MIVAASLKFHLILNCILFLVSPNNPVQAPLLSPRMDTESEQSITDHGAEQ